MAHLSGKDGAVYVAHQLLEDCEDDWTPDEANMAAAQSPAKKAGSNAILMWTPAGAPDTGILACEGVASVDITAYSKIMAWVRCSVLTSAGQLQLGVSETASMGGSPVWVDLPILQIDTWKHCVIDITTTGLNAVISCGAKRVVDIGAFYLYLDDIWAGIEGPGVTGWEVDDQADAIECTDFADAGVRAYIPAASGWKGSFRGHKDGAPLTIGQEVVLHLAESDTVYQNWVGHAIITNVKALTSFDALVGYEYSFQGTSDLEPAGA